MSAIQPTISTVGKVSLSIRLERAATSVATAAGVIAISGGVGVASDIGRHGARLDLIDQILILCSLRSLEAQSEILVTQSLGLFSGQMVDDTIAQLVDSMECVAVVSLSIKAALHIHLFQIAAAVADSTVKLVGVHCVAVSNILDCALNIAAAAGKLALNCVSVLQSLITQVADCAVQGAEIAIDVVGQLEGSIANTVVDAVQLALDGCKVGSQHIVFTYTAATAVTSTKAAEASTAPAKQ